MISNSRFTAAALTLSLAAGSLLPLSTAALADGWDERHDYHAAGDRDWRIAPDRRYRGFQQYRYADRGYRGDHGYGHSGWRDHRADDRREERRERKQIARGVAIGLGVLMLGLIASEANRNPYDRYDY